jgi:hypothetical protein
LICLGTWGVVSYLNDLRGKRTLAKPIREFLSNYAMLISIIVWFVCACTRTHAHARTRRP